MSRSASTGVASSSSWSSGSSRSAEARGRHSGARRNSRPWRARKGVSARVRPKTPPRVKKRTRKVRGHHHPELVGLGLVAAGVFLATLLWLGVEGRLGRRGAVSEACRRLVGDAAVRRPAALIAVGALMLARSALVDVPLPARVSPCSSRAAAALVARARGRDRGLAREPSRAVSSDESGGDPRRDGGDRGRTAPHGSLAGALLRRRHGPCVRRAGSSARRTFDATRAPAVVAARPPAPKRAPAPPVDAEQAFPDVVTDPWARSRRSSPTSRSRSSPTRRASSTSRRSRARKATTGSPTASCCGRSKAAAGSSAEHGARCREPLVQTLAALRRGRDVIGQISGPARDALRAPARARDEGLEGRRRSRTTSRTRSRPPRSGSSRRSPASRRSASRCRTSAANLVTLGDIFDDLPGTASPLAVWLGKDISGTAVWTDLARMPHILIAGTTGSGKSGCINTMLTSILLARRRTTCG